MKELAPGAKVLTQERSPASSDWSAEALASRQWGFEGVVVGVHNSHGLSYEVLHDHDGSVGHYEQHELDPLDTPVMVEPPNTPSAREIVSALAEFPKIADELRWRLVQHEQPSPGHLVFDLREETKSCLYYIERFAAREQVKLIPLLEGNSHFEKIANLTRKGSGSDYGPVMWEAHRVGPPRDARETHNGG